ncbi:MAG: FAD-binding oxidoreductase [Oscillochloridaceae bacterium umkhey_bin13]
MSGYDLTRLMIGSYGTLGIIAEVRLRTYPRPAATTSLVARFASRPKLDAALHALNGLVLRPTAADFLDAGTLQTLGLTGDYGLALRFAGNPAACQRQLDAARTLCEQQAAQVLPVTTALDEVALWERVVARTALHADPSRYQLRLAVPPAAFGAALAALEQQAARHGLALTVGGRARHGLLIAGFVTDPLTAAAFHQALLRDWPHSQLVAGNLPETAEPWRWGQPPAPMVAALQRQLKDAFDPHDLLNRGRYVVRVGQATPVGWVA